MDLVEKIKILKNHFNAKNYKRVMEGSLKLLKKIPRNVYLINLTGMAYQALSQHKNSIKFFKDYEDRFSCKANIETGIVNEELDYKAIK